MDTSRVRWWRATVVREQTGKVRSKAGVKFKTYAAVVGCA
jgi:hypothetical protein